MIAANYLVSVQLKREAESQVKRVETSAPKSNIIQLEFDSQQQVPAVSVEIDTNIDTNIIGDGASSTASKLLVLPGGPVKLDELRLQIRIGDHLRGQITVEKVQVNYLSHSKKE